MPFTPGLRRRTLEPRRKVYDGEATKGMNRDDVREYLKTHAENRYLREHFTRDIFSARISAEFIRILTSDLDPLEKQKALKELILEDHKVKAVFVFDPTNEEQKEFVFRFVFGLLFRINKPLLKGRTFSSILEREFTDEDLFSEEELKRMAEFKVGFIELLDSSQIGIARWTKDFAGKPIPLLPEDKVRVLDALEFSIRRVPDWKRAERFITSCKTIIWPFDDYDHYVNFFLQGLRSFSVGWDGQRYYDARVQHAKHFRKAFEFAKRWFSADSLKPVWEKRATLVGSDFISLISVLDKMFKEYEFTESEISQVISRISPSASCSVYKFILDARKKLTEIGINISNAQAKRLLAIMEQRYVYREEHNEIDINQNLLFRNIDDIFKEELIGNKGTFYGLRWFDRLSLVNNPARGELFLKALQNCLCVFSYWGTAAGMINVYNRPELGFVKSKFGEIILCAIVAASKNLSSERALDFVRSNVDVVSPGPYIR